MNVAIAGGRGFLGQALAGRLVDEGHRVLTLSRSPRGGAAWGGARSEAGWVPDGTADSWAEPLGRADAVVNLAGESIGDGRWTAARKQRILESRLSATRSLVAAVEGLRRPPAVLVNASAQGYYGDRGDEELTEQAPPGHGFLPDVCVRWELEGRRAEHKARVVLLRTGIVLDRDAGALPRMALPFRLFGGGPLGSGRQFMSWIHVADWVGIVLTALTNDSVQGPRNLGVPVPVRNREFANALGRALHRPSLLPAPAFALHLAVGEMAGPLLLASTRMLPAAVLADGYRFQYPDARGALASIFR
jgi:uncharacterized protein